MQRWIYKSSYHSHSQSCSCRHIIFQSNKPVEMHGNNCNRTRVGQKPLAGRKLCETMIPCEATSTTEGGNTPEEAILIRMKTKRHLWETKPNIQGGILISFGSVTKSRAGNFSAHNRIMTATRAFLCRTPVEPADNLYDLQWDFFARVSGWSIFEIAEHEVMFQEKRVCFFYGCGRSFCFDHKSYPPHTYPIYICTTFFYSAIDGFRTPSVPFGSFGSSTMFRF